jgi:hypothetical protein
LFIYRGSRGIFHGFSRHSPQANRLNSTRNRPNSSYFPSSGPLCSLNLDFFLDFEGYLTHLWSLYWTYEEWGVYLMFRARIDRRHGAFVDISCFFLCKNWYHY